MTQTILLYIFDNNIIHVTDNFTAKIPVNEVVMEWETFLFISGQTIGVTLDTRNRSRLLAGKLWQTKVHGTDSLMM